MSAGRLDVQGGRMWPPRRDRLGQKHVLCPITEDGALRGVGLLPLVIAGNRPGHEIEYPLAVVIVGGLFTSTLLNLLLMPTLYLRFGQCRASDAPEP